MRESRDSKTVVDLSVPMSRKKRESMVTEDSCFGRELDFETRECQVCADNELCALLFKDKVDDKAKDFEKRKGPTLDMADLSLIDEEGLYKDIVERSGEMTSGELCERVMSESRLRDSVAILEWIKRFKEARGFKIRKGIVYAE